MTNPEAPFTQPWQAQLFAFTVALNDAEVFTWKEWTAVFGPKVQHVAADSYWDIWADALIELLETLHILSRQELADLTWRWQASARATPHGQPIHLLADLP